MHPPPGPAVCMGCPPTSVACVGPSAIGADSERCARVSLEHSPIPVVPAEYSWQLLWAARVRARTHAPGPY